MQTRRFVLWPAAVIAALTLVACRAGDGTRAAPDPVVQAWQGTLGADLEADVRALAEGFPGRSVRDPERLEASARWLEERLAAMGYAVRTDSYEMPGADGTPITVRNLWVEVPARGEDDRWLVVGAHYDTVPDSPGADDNASGVAGVLALASHFRDRPQAIGLRFELYTNEELILGGRAHMGSLRRAEAARAAGEPVVAAIVLEMIGYYSGGPLTPEARRFAELAGVQVPRDDLFLAAAGWEPARGLAERIAASWKGPVRVLPVLTPVGEPTAARSDHWAWLQAGVPAVMLTDTAEFRNPHYHGPTDRPETLDFARMAEALGSIRGVVASIASDPTLADPRATAGPPERIEIENGGPAPVTVATVGTGEPAIVPPGGRHRMTTAAGATVILEGMADLRLGQRAVGVTARRMAPIVWIHVEGRPGRGGYTEGGSVEFERNGPITVVVDEVRVRVLPVRQD
jgi:hypothetical protein